MRVEQAETVRYRLPIGDTDVELAPLLGRPLVLEYTGNIFCIECGRKTRKSFNQGHCFPCLRKLASCDTCIVKPELCHYAEGTCREPDWAQTHCMQPHVVYLANSSGVKVGITRRSQIPTRWIDQGAVQALPLYEVGTRLHSGVLEVALKSVANDRTDWRRMLRGGQPELDLLSERDRILAAAGDALARSIAGLGSDAVKFLKDADEMRFSYPVLRNPEKVKALNFDKQDRVEGVLEGIRGQYLILDCGVLNIRKFGGYELSLTLT
tara:strand:+ start:715 stop:1512 length:798 start_codon:yes stop_codon:yes gene_type:complete